jgi:hypothetical protein
MPGQVMTHRTTRAPTGLAVVTGADNMAGKRARKCARAEKGT